MGAHISVSSTQTGSRHRYEDEDEDPAVPSELGALWCREEDLESEDDGNEPPQRPITPAYDRAVSIRFSPSPSGGMVRPLQDDSNTEVFPENIIDHLRVQMGMLRRQTSEARSEAASIAQQLSECQAELSKTRTALRAVEDMLEVEIQKRKEAERVAEEEARVRKAAEDELQTLQARELETTGA
jgi:hypothetical protein